MNRFTVKDFEFMRRALVLADRAKGRTFPNPAVGAVIVKNGRILAEGATHRCGGPHAEADALRKAGRMARKAIMYVTLEPCGHFGRTPPCTGQIIESGIQKVFIAVGDPNPLVRGKGIRQLRAHGIEVEIGLLAGEARLINEDFFWSIQNHVPWITLKLGMTLDGRIADRFGKSRWITNGKSRHFVHELRRKHAAVAVGAATLLADNPQMTVRHVRGVSPVRIVFSSNPGIGHGTHFRNDARRYRSIIVCPGGKEGTTATAPDGVEIWYTGKARNPRNLAVFSVMAFKENLTSILIEGGQRLASSFLEAGLVNRLYLFYGNRLLGGGKDAVSFRRQLPLHDAISLKEPAILAFDDTFAVTGCLF